STIGTDSGATSTISSGGLTKDTTLALSGTVSDANGVSSVEIFDGATSLGNATLGVGTWSFTTAALSDASHSFTAKATDNAGNVTTTSAVTATVDTTAPNAASLAVDPLISADDLAVGVSYTVAGLDPDATAVATFSDGVHTPITAN